LSSRKLNAGDQAGKASRAVGGFFEIVFEAERSDFYAVCKLISVEVRDEFFCVRENPSSIHVSPIREVYSCVLRNAPTTHQGN
jgi:hypothetical protein